jgi:hypothetical protein
VIIDLTFSGSASPLDKGDDQSEDNIFPWLIKAAADGPKNKE